MSPDLSILTINKTVYFLNRQSSQRIREICSPWDFYGLPKVAISSDNHYLAYLITTVTNGKRSRCNLLSVFDLTDDAPRQVWSYSQHQFAEALGSPFSKYGYRNPDSNHKSGWSKTSLTFAPGSHILHVSLHYYTEVDCFLKDIDTVGGKHHNTIYICAS